MARDRYESGRDLLNEKAIASFFIRHRGDDLGIDGCKKLPDSYGVDYMMVGSGHLRCWAEVKSRPAITRWGRFDTVLLSVLKWESGLKHRAATNKPFRFIVRAGDGTVAAYVFRPDDVNFDVEWGGRTVQTRDNADIEPVVMIPIQKFDVIGVLSEDDFGL